jgi:hypothetical protein
VQQQGVICSGFAAKYAGDFTELQAAAQIIWTRRQNTLLFVLD